MECEWCENVIDEEEIYDVGGELVGCCVECLENIPIDDRVPVFTTSIEGVGNGR